MNNVNIATLKAQLSAILAKVRKGARFQIHDRKTPIALLYPLHESTDPLVLRHGEGKVSIPRPVKNSVTLDAVELLRQDRSRR